MNIFKKTGSTSLKLRRTGSFTAILLVTLTFNSYSMEWIASASSALLNGFTGLKQFLTATTNPGTGFSDLPVEVQTEILKFLAASCTSKTLKDSAQTINALAQTSKHLNNVINDPEFNLKLIKSRAKQFNVSDVKVANALQTEASKTQLKIQLALAKIMKELIEEQENNNALTRLNKLLKRFEIGNKVYTVDLDFTYRWNKKSQEYGSPLVYAVLADNKFLINYFVENGANINQAGFNGKTPLMYANNADIITFLAAQPNLNINQQDANGNTALLRALQSYFPEDEENRDQNIAIIQALIDNGANPTIANNSGETPLEAAQATGDQVVTNIIQQAVGKMQMIDKIEL
jgi:ankyrin repeat protein